MRQHFLLLIVSVTVSLGLASCASMSPEECRTAQWSDVGLRDGLNGAPLSVLQSRTDACAKADVVVDSPAYLAGRDKGLERYCRLENAIPQGLSGATYAHVCPAEIDAAFQLRHQMGYRVYALRQELRNLEDRIASIENRLRDNNRAEDDRIRNATSDAERSKVRNDIDTERRRLRNDLADADWNARRKRDALRAAEWDLNNLRP